MKQCRTDCIHAEACRRYADNSTYWQNGDCPIYKPTTDVVPKSEVEKIFEEFDKIMHGYRVDKLLAELGVHIVKHGESTLEQRIAELKKKYTKSEDTNVTTKESEKEK